MNKHLISGFLKQAARYNIPSEAGLELLKQADVTGWLDRFLTNTYDDTRAGLSHLSNDAGVGGFSAGKLRDFFSAANPFGANSPVDYFTDFGQRMANNEQGRRFDKAMLFSDIARNSGVNTSLSRANNYGQMAQAEANQLADVGQVNQVASNLNTARNVNKGIQLQTNRIDHQNTVNMNKAQKSLNTPFDLTQPVKKPNNASIKPKPIDPLKEAPSANMRKPLFSMSNTSNVRI